MAYLGNRPAESYASFETETFSVSATANYTLSHAVTNENEIRLVINGVVQQPGSGKAYTASGTTLTLTSATVSGDVMYAVYLGRALQTVNPPNASVGLSQLSATGTKNSTTFLRGDNTFAVPSGGKIGQVVQTVKTDVFQTSSSSFTDVTGLSVSITPSATTSKILCICTGIYGKTTNDNFHHQLVRDSTALLANILDPGTDTNQTEVFSVQFLDSPSSTSALTYKLQIKNDGTNPVNINRNNAGTNDRGDSTITVMEVLA